MAHTRWSVSLFVAAFWLPVAAFGQSPEFVTAMDRMAELYEKGQYQEAISYAAEALKLSEQELGPNHPITASPLAYLGLIHQAEGRYSEAAPFLERALEILEMALGPEHPDVAISLNNLSALFIEQGRYAEAEPLLDRALAILEKAFGPRHLDVATILDNLASLKLDQGSEGEFIPLFHRALAIRVKALGLKHPTVVESLNFYIDVLRDGGNKFAADKIEAMISVPASAPGQSLGQTLRAGGTYHDLVGLCEVPHLSEQRRKAGTVASQIWNMPSMSMLPEIGVGDLIVGIKIEAADIIRGDIAIFKLPRDNTVPYVKRIVGLPGDRIQVKNGFLYINDVAVERRQINDFSFTDTNGRDRSIAQHTETLPNGVSHRTLDANPHGVFDNTDIYAVPEGHYFSIGDNRDESLDSRIDNAYSGVGFIPAQNFMALVACTVPEY